MRNQKGQQPTDTRHRNIGENQKRPLEGLEHGVQDDEDQQNGDGQHDKQAFVCALLALVFSSPINVISLWQLHLLGDLVYGFFDCASKIATANAVLDSDVALFSFTVDCFSTIDSLDFGQL